MQIKVSHSKAKKLFCNSNNSLVPDAEFSFLKQQKNNEENERVQEPLKNVTVTN